VVNISHREIERRFLVEALPPEIKAFPAVPCEQGYISGHPVTVRIRRSGNRPDVLSVKRGPMENREECEIDLTPGQSETLWPLTLGWRISKTRRRIPAGEWTIEVDEFASPHDGLIIAEVEFSSESEARAYDPPAWFGREITSDPAYSNARLAAAR